METGKIARELFDSFAIVVCGPVKQVLETMQGEAALLTYLHEVNTASTPTEISSWLRVSTSRVANLLNSLDKKALIAYRHDNVDKRRVYITLTEKGREIAIEKEKDVIQMLERLVTELGEKDSLEYMRLTKRVAEISAKRADDKKLAKKAD